MVVLKDVLRKYRKFIDEFVPYLTKMYLDQINDAEGKAAFVWVLGEFGQLIEDAPYLLEKIIEEEIENGDTHLLSHLVTSCSKLFFQRAPEMHKILAGLFKHVMANSFDLDLRQKVTFYYRLLKQDTEVARQIIAESGAEFECTEFYEDRQSEKRERLFMEFNSLSVVYGKPSEKFLRDQVLKQSIAAEKKYYPKERGFKNTDQSDKLLETVDEPKTEQA